jgi:hypothetical protein
MQPQQHLVPAPQILEALPINHIKQLQNPPQKNFAKAMIQTLYGMQHLTQARQQKYKHMFWSAVKQPHRHIAGKPISTARMHEQTL